MEFHISRKARDLYRFDENLFSLKGTVLFSSLSGAREFARRVQQKNPNIRYQDIFAMGLIDEILHYVLVLYGRTIGRPFSQKLFDDSVAQVGEKRVKTAVRKFVQLFPPHDVYTEQISSEAFLESSVDDSNGWAQEFEEMLMLWVENQNPAYGIAQELFDDGALEKACTYKELVNDAYTICRGLPAFGPFNQNIIDMLRAPALAHPHSLEAQLEYIRTNWGYLLGDFLSRLLRGIDYLKEVNAFFARQGIGGPAKETYVLEYSGGGGEEYERFSPDRDWMPRTVLLAKTTLVWLDQLSKKFGTQVSRLDQIPDEELDLIAGRGFNSLWLIGLWQRSDASRKIKHRCGNPEAASSAYALYDYEIADEIGGWQALENLRWRAWNRGIRLASDMVPNHTGIESKWITEHPDWFVQLSYPPFPSYTFNGETLSGNDGIGVYLEDHYYNQSDAAVVFKRVDHRTGDTRYIYHGNDGTHMPWNDTAQLNFLKKEVREAVIQTIIHVAKNFPIIRFDAAMTLAKKHIQRLWFPEPGHGGDIPSRAEHGMTMADFNAAIPEEFWREVVDRCAKEAPDTLLLAEAFWMMEGYFVRTLGMHRVYNSAFMNMLKNEDNAKYRQTIKNTVSFDKDILKRFVNFMNNPDEETAVAQFGNGDKYFGVCTLMVTMPGLPMFGHGQVEGLTEKYGMEYRRAYKDETADSQLVERHYREIFPIVKKRYLFAEVENFFMYDLIRENGEINENVFAYSNAYGPERALVLYNNSYEATWGRVDMSAGFVDKSASSDRTVQFRKLAQAFGLRNDPSYYCLLREQRSGLWYIRRCSELYENGLGVVLQGYQSQVYLEVLEVSDNSYQHYRQLHDHLGGAGVPDILAAIRNLVLGPIYQVFATTLGDEIWESANDIFDRKRIGGSQRVRVLKDGFKAFVEAALSYSPNPEELKSRAVNFETHLTNVLKVLDAVHETESLNAKHKAAKQFVLDGLRNEAKPVSLLATLVLFAFRDENEEWGLQHKIGPLGDFRHSVASLVSVIDTIGIWSGGKPAATDLIEGLSFMELQEYLLVNYYNGVRWFNKERFEALAWWATVWSMVSGGDTSPAIMTALYERSKKWLEAMAASEYKLDVFKNSIQVPKSLLGNVVAKVAASPKSRQTGVKTGTGTPHFESSSSEIASTTVPTQVAKTKPAKPKLSPTSKDGKDKVQPKTGKKV